MNFLKNLCLLLLFFTIAIRTTAQCPVNIGFENGNYDNWNVLNGGISMDGTMFYDFNGPLSSVNAIIDSRLFYYPDPYGLFPQTSPNGSTYSVKLGNDASGAKAESLTYTYVVPTGLQYTFVFYSAIVLEDPSHLPYQQPRFTVKINDVTDGRYIPCPSYDFVASNNLQGFKLSTSPAGIGQSVYFTNWQATTINLVGYAGETIRLEFSVNDCTLGGHFGYVYLDLDQTCGQSIKGNTYCPGSGSVILSAPPGFAQYTWYTGDLSKKLDTTQNLTLSPAPPNQTKYAVEVVPFPSFGCPDTLYTYINAVTVPFQFKVRDTIYGCNGIGADLTDPSVTTGSSKGMVFSYFTDSLGMYHLPHPNATDNTGTYYIMGVDTNGCSNILPVNVVIIVPSISVINPPAVEYPNTVDISKAVVHQTGYTYSYFSDAKTTVPITDFTAIKHTGTYFIKAVNSYGCSVVEAVQVTVEPPPPFTIEAPNTFTPNGDGINDHFMFTLTGFVDFATVKIYNRYGQLVFTGKLISGFWDGTLNGQNLPAGTYYWVFNGTDTYYGKPVTKGGHITLLR